MSEKILILVFSLFFLTGGLAYERHLTEKGEVGPVGRLLDFVRLGQYDPEGYAKRTSRQQTVHVDLETNLARLKEKHLAIELQRLKLVEHRQEILKELMALDEDISVQAAQYAQAIAAEREDFLKKSPQIEQVGQAIISNYSQPDPQLRQANYEQIRDQLQTVLKDLAPEPEKDLPRWTEILEKMDEVMVPGSAANLSCADPAKCLEESLQYLRKDIKQWGKDHIDIPQQELAQLSSLAKQVDKEFEIYEGNLAASEKLLQEGDLRMESRFQELTQQLAAVTEEDMRVLMALYDELREEQLTLLNNLEFNRERLWKSQLSLQRQLEKITQYFRQAGRAGADQLTQKAERLQKEVPQFSSQLINDDEELKRIVQDRWQEHDRFMNDLALKSQFDLKRLREQRAMLVREKADMNNSRLGSRQEMEAQADRANDLRTGGASSDDLGEHNQRLRDRSGSAARSSNFPDASLQRARDRARDQGFYD